MQGVSTISLSSAPVESMKIISHSRSVRPKSFPISWADNVEGASFFLFQYQRERPGD